MKIAQVAPVWESVPPRRYGGIEVIVYLLSEELIKRGHEVTLFATGDSITSARLISSYDMPPPRNMLKSYNPVPDLIHIGNAFRHAEQFDVIHNHTGYVGTALGSLVNKPVLDTLHGRFTQDNFTFYESYKNAVFYNSISFGQRKSGPNLNYVANIYNSIDIDSYRFNQEKKDYFVHISRVSPDKGTHIAVDVALKAGVKLVIAGKIDPGKDTVFYEEKIAPKVDGKQIIYMGEVSEEGKRTLLMDARGFIFPLQWAEPFGLVMVEAMASGTPIISFPFGSVPEIVQDGKTGFVVSDIEQMVEAVNDIERIKPHDCRKRVEQNFGIDRMVDEYEKVYSKLIEIKTDQEVPPIDICKPYAVPSLEVPPSVVNSPWTEM